MREIKEKEALEMLSVIDRLHRCHESWLETYPHDLSTVEGKTYAINNVIRETRDCMNYLCDRLVVQKDISPESAQDLFMMILTNANDMMDKYTGRDISYYEMSIKEMLDEIEKEGEQ